MGTNLNVTVTTGTITVDPSVKQGNVQYTLTCTSDSTIAPQQSTVGVGATVTFDNVAPGTYTVTAINLDANGNTLAGTSPVISAPYTVVTEQILTVVTGVSLSQ